MQHKLHPPKRFSGINKSWTLWPSWTEIYCRTAVLDCSVYKYLACVLSHISLYWDLVKGCLYRWLMESAWEVWNIHNISTEAWWNTVMSKIEKHFGLSSKYNKSIIQLQRKVNEAHHWEKCRTVLIHFHIRGEFKLIIVWRSPKSKTDFFPLRLR